MQLIVVYKIAFPGRNLRKSRGIIKNVTRTDAYRISNNAFSLKYTGNEILGNKINQLMCLKEKQ